MTLPALHEVEGWRRAGRYRSDLVLTTSTDARNAPGRIIRPGK